MGAGGKAKLHDASAGSTASPPPILEAGGVLIRRHQGRWEVGLVRPNVGGTGDDRTGIDRTGDPPALPCAVVASGQDFQGAVVDGVRQRAGVEGRVGAFAGWTCETIEGTRHTRLFWVVEPARPECEAEGVAWVAAEEACEKLGPAEGALVHRVVEEAERSRRRFRLPRYYAGFRKRRLDRRLESFEANLLVRIRTSKKSGDWIESTLRLLDLARAASKHGDVDAGWHHLLAARRAELGGHTAHELEAHATALKIEAEEKVGRWRSRAIESLLTDPTAHEDVARIRAATLIRDEHAQNQYAKLELLHDHLTKFLLLLVLALGGVILSHSYGPIAGFLPTGENLPDPLAALLLGLLGGTVSAIQPGAGGKNKRIPEVLESWLLVALRPALGAAFGLVAYLFLVAGLLEVVKVSPAMVLGVAFAAGFSERVVVRAIEGFTA